ncbi:MULTISPECIES: hypothetical protein [unclassified Bradyrhizobium]|uniref:hypothetical protein n=1 Tax=unclassified Bradyrhizobium TaxID=2631580 RepID=UPI00291680CB|nr:MULTISPECIES: hypothetical protein [unclassified Bradyrhizobium]
MVERNVREIAISALLDGRSRAADSVPILADDMPLGEAGLAISSLALLRAFIIVEDKLCVRIDDAAVADAQFATVGDFVRFVTRIDADRQT